MILFDVLLVDDEPYVREGIKNLIDWKKCGFNLCGEADNGEKAIGLAVELSPHVIITDIKMPLMDGLELIKIVSQIANGRIKFIILSGYNEFEFAKTAMQYNVKNYILKPIDEDELSQSLKKLYIEIESEMKFNILKNNIVFYEGTKDFPYNHEFVELTSIPALIEAIESNQENSIHSIIHSIYDKLYTLNITSESVHTYINSFKNEIMKIMHQMGGNMEEILTDFPVQSIEVNKITSDESREAMIDYSIKIAAYIEALRRSQSLGIIADIRNYILRNYQNKITLKSISEHFYINPVYLGQLFKKKLGISFNDYLSNLRVEEAKKLLRRKDMKVYEIAKGVGYNEPDYFISRFEKAVGMTPAQYRQKHLGK